MKQRLLEGIDQPELKANIEQNFDELISNFKSEQEKQLAKV